MTRRDLPDDARLVPDKAEKVFSGVMFDVYQWQQEMFDGNYKTYEMIKRPDTVLVIALDDDDKVVVMREEQPNLPVRETRVPGGRVEPSDESTLAAAQRELFEETGLKMREWKLVEVVQTELKIEWFIHVFVARGVESEQKSTPDAGGEKIEVRRIPYEELSQANVDRSRIMFFRKYTTTAEVTALFD
jgi:ADP-ribose pyrophosphatase YjhB (NUDIX family)